jgi:hypothetical protein
MLKTKCMIPKKPALVQRLKRVMHGIVCRPECSVAAQTDAHIAGKNQSRRKPVDQAMSSKAQSTCLRGLGM